MIQYQVFYGRNHSATVLDWGTVIQSTGVVWVISHHLIQNGALSLVYNTASCRATWQSAGHAIGYPTGASGRKSVCFHFLALEQFPVGVLFQVWCRIWFLLEPGVRCEGCVFQDTVLISNVGKDLQSFFHILSLPLLHKIMVPWTFLTFYINFY